MGEPCVTNADCSSDVCFPLGGGDNVCSDQCEDETDCVSGWTCETLTADKQICQCRAATETCNEEDDDCDGNVDEDSCGEPETDGGTVAAPECGDTNCDRLDGESCTTCEEDCGPCEPICGDDTCDEAAGETCTSCEMDCGVCPPRCGDSHCDTGTETCTSCARDCGTCPVMGCDVPGSGDDTRRGDSCAGVAPETWRCAHSLDWDLPVSQVCRDGVWINFNLNPRDCDACCHAFTEACRAP